MSDLIDRQAAIDEIEERKNANGYCNVAVISELNRLEGYIMQLPSAEPEDYTELKREFLRMASYIDILLECSDEQKETLIGFISRLAEFMPWTERD